MDKKEILALLIIFSLWMYLVIPYEKFHRSEEDIELKLFKLINEERIRVGASQLNYDIELTRLAKEHSKDMLEESYFKHSKNGVGENIVETPLYPWVEGCIIVFTNNQVAKCMFKGWKKSSGHYANMIDLRYTKTGLGVACDSFICKGIQTFNF